jgi:hypothetical protein
MNLLCVKSTSLPFMHIKLPKGLFPADFQAKIPSESLFATMHATFPARLDFT